MPVGKTWNVEAASQIDSESGVSVERITDDVANTYYPYFTQPIVTNDGRFVMLSSDRTGLWQMFARDMQAGRIVQLTDRPGVRHHNSCLDPAQGVVYYFADRELRRVGIDGADDRPLYECPPGYRPGILSISSCGRYLAFAYVEDLPVSTSTGVIYSEMAERLFQRPRSVLMRIDVTGPRFEALYGECEWYSHVSICPADPDLVMFCHEGSWAWVQRIWVVRASTREVWPLVVQKRLLERSGHEYFTDRGRVVTQYAVRSRPDSQDWRHANILVDPDGGNEQRFWYEGRQPAHVQTSHGDDARMVADCGPRPLGEGPQGDQWLSLLRLTEDGRSELQPLCRHDTSWKTQHSHPHPIFWPDDQSVLFNSDRGGRCNVYRAPAAWKE